MNKFIFYVGVSVLLSLGASAQKANNKPSDKANQAMVLITGIDIKGRSKIKFNFGQVDKTRIDTSEQIIPDKNGLALKFNTMDEALEFLKRDGYSYVSSFAYTFDGKQINQYLMEKKIQKQLKFKIGDGVSVTTGPLQGIYGTVIFFDEDASKYLIRFTGTQQIYFSENEIIFWEK